MTPKHHVTERDVLLAKHSYLQFSSDRKTKILGSPDRTEKLHVLDESAEREHEDKITMIPTATYYKDKPIEEHRNEY